MPIAKKHDTRSLYFTKGITEAVGKIFQYPLTIVEAPMGYGKTTAVREFLSKRGQYRIMAEYLR